jgi:riboflavin biosynthesis pyrimidine reductase
MSWLENYQPLTGVRLNMVAGPGGELVDELGSSRGISNDLDRQLIGKLRSLADVFVTGGNTARRENYQNSHKLQLAVISHNVENSDGRITLNAPKDETLPAWVLSELRNQGFERILLEVGPSLAKKFLAADLVDEFCLTIPVGGLEVANMVVKRLESSLVISESLMNEQTLFTRWRRGND